MSGVLSVLREYLALVAPSRFTEAKLFWASVHIAFVISAVIAWIQEHKALLDEKAKNAKPEIKCDIRAAYSNQVCITINNTNIIKASDSIVTLELCLENLRQVPTTIQNLELTIDAVLTLDSGVTRPVESFTGKFLFAPLDKAFYTEREEILGQVNLWNEPLIDETITATKPLTYGLHKTCWARFYVKGLQPGTYQDATIKLRITDGLSGQHYAERVTNVQYDKIKETVKLAAAPRLR